VDQREAGPVEPREAVRPLAGTKFPIPILKRGPPPKLDADVLGASRTL
jgi:hypothetical protein